MVNHSTSLWSCVRTPATTINATPFYFQAPTWEELASKYSSQPNVKIAKGKCNRISMFAEWIVVSVIEMLAGARIIYSPHPPPPPPWTFHVFLSGLHWREFSLFSSFCTRLPDSVVVPRRCSSRRIRTRSISRRSHRLRRQVYSAKGWTLIAFSLQTEVFIMRMDKAICSVVSLSYCRQLLA